ncbi:fatty acyl-CoA hydrolase precursor, medium chain-like [Protopterus annectens]|uniref:fatty acyl-CoA hydrolase precursor, medium chain-like n=1 Tax=Protopterus annectens TaxID=7888 RepID=UPI001CFA492C|nr:fatty acyl-CoA hydrolase precursor, medium chain-like [Protopterus annectens]
MTELYSSMIVYQNIKLLGLLLLLWVSEVEGNKSDNPVVSTNYGQLKGKRVEVKDTEKAVYSYLGVPFAKPPVGPLRFSPPQPVESWKGVREATTYPPMCLQDMKMLQIIFDIMKVKMPALESKEDCLYLNVHTPVHPSEEAKLPVMVWIHGGALVSDGASSADGSPLAAYGNVVVVTIQYRLGIFGFFSTGDEHARGNWGLLDQVAALRWVKENIKSFGGDPDSVTIFGESAGGISVSFHVLSNLSSGLFHKAISDSGAAFSPGFYSHNPQSFAKEFASFIGCNTSENLSMVQCLRLKSEEEILNTTISLKISSMPVVHDGVFLKKSLEELFRAKEFNSVPYLLGVNNHEAGWLLPSLFFPSLAWQSGIERGHIDSFMDDVFNILKSGKEMKSLLKEEYFKDIQDPIQLRDLLLELIGDFLLVIPIIRVANYHRDAQNPVYLYEFQHRPSAFRDSRPDFVKSDHADEIGFVFGAPFSTSDFVLLENATEEEKIFSKTVMAYWSNFARTGSPNGKGLLEWPVYDQEENYMKLNIKQDIASHLKENRMFFWTKTLPAKIKEMSEEEREHSELYFNL